MSILKLVQIYGIEKPVWQLTQLCGYAQNVSYLGFLQIQPY